MDRLWYMDKEEGRKERSKPNVRGKRGIYE
jgi:hypothetical protein